jgi:multidrug efflux pump subunit AcrA (membrane-fusion protein)
MDRSGIEDLEGAPRWRLIAIAVAAVVALILGFLIVRSVFSGGDGKEEPYTEYVVGKMTIRNMITTSGVAISQEEAILGFPIPGQVTDILVELGQEVQIGQPLVKVKADELENAVSTAESGVAMARLQLRKMLEGATSAEISNSEDAVEAARAALIKAQNDLQDALDPPDEADLSAADQAITAAQAALSTAQSKLDTVINGASEADIAAADSQVVLAETNYNQAENAEEDSQENMDNAETAFETAADVYCGSAEEFCENWYEIEETCNFWRSLNTKSRSTATR